MEKKNIIKTKTDDFQKRVEKIKAERTKFYDGLKEIESLKKEFYDAEAEALAKEKDAELGDTTEVLSTLRLSGDKHPGKKVVVAERKFQLFSLDKIKKIEKFHELKTLLEFKADVDHLMNEKLYFKMYLLMSIETNYDVVQSCYDLLKKSIMEWSPSFRHIIKIFLNWGATCQTMGIIQYESEVIFSKGIRYKKNCPSGEFSFFNYSKVFNYIAQVFERNGSRYSKTETVILIKCLIALSLDETFAPLGTNISFCICKCFESFPQWDNFTVVNICRLLFNEDHFHNKIAIITRTLPKIGRCNDISSCLSYALLSTFQNRAPQYSFPFEDEAIVETLTAIKVDADSKEDLYKLYVLIQLLNFMIYQREMYNNPLVLQKIKDYLDILKWEIARSRNTFDAAFVKGRIMYCCAMWSLSGPEAKVEFY